MKPPIFIVLGGIIVDNIVAADGRVRRRRAGGNAVYAAAGARLWAKRVGLVGVVPKNYPAAFLDHLRQAEIDLEGVKIIDETVSYSEWFFHRPDGSRADHLHATEAEADAFAADGDVVTPDKSAAFELLLRSSPRVGLDFVSFRAKHPLMADDVPARFRGAYAAHLAPGPPGTLLRLLGDLRKFGMRIGFDPGFAAAELAPKIQDWASLPDILLPSEKELRLLIEGLDPERSAMELLSRGARRVAVKLGSSGSLFADGSISKSIPALPVDAPDPTGAGDAFCGGFMAAWQATDDPIAAVLAGTVAASFAVQDFGPNALLKAEPREVRARLQALARDDLKKSSVNLLSILHQES